MDQFNKIVSESLKSKRPNLSDKSLKSYVSTLINLPKKMEDKPDNINYFEKNVDKIIKFLKDNEYTLFPEQFCYLVCYS